MRAKVGARTLLELASVLALGAFAVALATCDRSGGQSGGNAAADPVVLSVDGVEVRESELNRYVPFLNQWDPTLSKAHIRRVLLNDYILPSKVLPRFVSAQERSEAVRKAESLSRAVQQAGGDLEALRRYGRVHDGKDYDLPVLPLQGDLQADVAEAVFTTPVGLATKAVHSTFGSVVAGVVSEETSELDGRRARRLYAVYFPYSTRQNLSKDVTSAVRSLKAKVALIHPRYLDELAPLFTERKPLVNR